MAARMAFRAASASARNELVDVQDQVEAQQRSFGRDGVELSTGDFRKKYSMCAATEINRQKRDHAPIDTVRLYGPRLAEHQLRRLAGAMREIRGVGSRQTDQTSRV
jgi:hypothetical protein